jgi:hypothetical protein
MGICFDVHSIVHTPPYPPIVPGSKVEAQWYDQQWDYVHDFCQHFGWKSTPWEEPSDRHGKEDYSCSWSRFDLLRAVAVCAAQDRRFVTQADAWAHAGPIESAGRFLHILDRGDSSYTALYVPVGITVPAHFATSSIWDVITVASSIRLQHELEDLGGVLATYIAEQGTKGIVDPVDDHLGYTWDALEDLCTRLTALAHESQSFKLPLFASY